jgi:hypothetical protein
MKLFLPICLISFACSAAQAQAPTRTVKRPPAPAPSPSKGGNHYSGWIFVKNLAGRTDTLVVDVSDTIDAVRQKYEEKTNASAAGTDFIFAGKRLLDGKTLSDYNVQIESTLHAVPKRR